MKRKFMIGLIVFEVIAGILVLLMMPGPRLRYLGVQPKDANGTVYLKYELRNSSLMPIYYQGYGPTLPLYQESYKTGSTWRVQFVSWCGTGAQYQRLGPLASTNVFFAVSRVDTSCVWRLGVPYVRTTWALPHGILGLVFTRPFAGWGIAWSDGMRFGARPSVIRKAETHVGRGIGSQTNDCPQKPASASWPKTYNWWKTFAFKNWRDHPFDSTNAPQIQAVVLVGISGVCREYSPLVVLRRDMSTNDIPELDGREFTFRSNALVEHLCQLPTQSQYPDLCEDAWFAIYCAANHTVRGFRLFLRPSAADFTSELGVAAAISNEVTRIQADTP
jgi:hypothetical protein